MNDNVKKYLPRVIEPLFKKKLANFGAVWITGCKWCGKSTTAKMLGKSVVEVQDTEDNQGIRQIAANQPSVILAGEKPRVIDEWQDAPELWDAVRHDVDDTGLTGQYILTGSSTPAVRRDGKKPMHSGAGRIAKITMRPMSLYESGESSGEVSLTALLNGNTDVAGSANLGIQEIVELCTRGGWPASVIRMSSDGDLAREYLNAIVEREGSLQELEYYSPGRMRALLRGLARSVAAPAKISTLINDVAANTGSAISDATAANYLSILEQIYIVDDVEAWCPKIRSKTEIRTGKKCNLVDPSLAVAALYATKNDLMMDFNSLGLVFESLALRDLKVYMESLGGELFYYRDQNGVECDAVAHLNGHWVGIEIKLGADDDTVDGAAVSLSRFKNVVDTEEMREPECLMVLSGLAKYAYKRQDGVLVVPIGCLKN